MGLFDLFKKKPQELDLTKDLVLSKMDVGYFVDFELESYEVVAKHYYDLGDEGHLDEWVLNSGKTTYYLERYEDDEVSWSLSQKIPIGAIDSDVRAHIMQHDDPPNRLTYKGDTYYLDGSDAGYFYENGRKPAYEFITWTFVDEADERLLTVEQWDEDAFEAAAGRYVEEYQFTHILPGQKKS